MADSDEAGFLYNSQLVRHETSCEQFPHNWPALFC